MKPKNSSASLSRDVQAKISLALDSLKYHRESIALKDVYDGLTLLRHRKDELVGEEVGRFIYLLSQAAKRILAHDTRKAIRLLKEAQKIFKGASLVKQASLRFKDYIRYYKSQILVSLQKDRAHLLSKIEELLSSETPEEVERHSHIFSSLCNQALSQFRDFKVLFVSGPVPSNSDALLIKGVYQIKEDRIAILINSAFDPLSWEEGAEGLLLNFLKVLNVALDHELIHRAQELVDGRKFSLWNFLKSKLSINWYLEDPRELKAYGNTLAQDLAYRGIYHVEENVQALQQLRKESSLLNALFSMMNRKLSKREMKRIFLPIVKQANKWLKYYEKNPEALQVPKKVSPWFGQVPQKV